MLGRLGATSACRSLSNGCPIQGFPRVQWGIGFPSSAVRGADSEAGQLSRFPANKDCKNFSLVSITSRIQSIIASSQRRTFSAARLRCSSDSAWLPCPTAGAILSAQSSVVKESSEIATCSASAVKRSALSAVSAMEFSRYGGFSKNVRSADERRRIDPMLCGLRNR